LAANGWRGSEIDFGVGLCVEKTMVLTRDGRPCQVDYDEGDDECERDTTVVARIRPVCADRQITSAGALPISVCRASSDEAGRAMG
jgi:hypothetical protein